MSHGVGSVVVVNAGEEAFLDLVLAVGYTLHLYTTDVTSGLTPSQIDALVAGDFTEATFTGYASKALTGGAWTTTPADPSTASYAAQSFTSTANQTAQSIWGYYVTLTAGGALRWFEQFPAPVTIEFLADQLDITPRITLDDSEGNAMLTGAIIEWPSDTVPAGYLLCDGSAVSRTTYADLFAVIGTTYGVGDGSTTFNLPNRQQKFGLGKAASGTGATLGETGGAIDHTHPLDSTTSAALNTLTGGGTTSPFIKRKTVTSWDANVELITGVGATTSTTTGITTGSTLTGSSDTANPPYIALNYVIKT